MTDALGRAMGAACAVAVGADGTTFAKKLVVHYTPVWRRKSPVGTTGGAFWLLAGSAYALGGVPVVPYLPLPRLKVRAGPSDACLNHFSPAPGGFE